MRRRRAFFVITVAACAMATTADAATVGVPGGPSVQVPDVKVPQLPTRPSLPKVEVPKVQAPGVKLPSAPSGVQGPVERLGRSLPGGGTAGGGSGVAGSGAAGSSARRSAGSSPGSSSSRASGSRAAASPGSRGRPLSAPQRRARDVSERRTLRRGVQRLRGCLGVISSFEREVLVLRSGVSGPERSRTQVAQELDTSVRRVQRGERSGLRELRDAARSTGCAGGAAMSFSDSGSDQLASATIAVATGGAPSLRPVATMAGSDDSQLASVRRRPAGQALGAKADSGAAPSSEERPLLSTVATSTASVGSVDGSLSPLLLLLLLVLLVPLTLVALRRRPAAAGPVSAPAPESPAAPSPRPEPVQAPSFTPFRPPAELESQLEPHAEPRSSPEPQSRERAWPQPSPPAEPVAEPPAEEPTASPTPAPAPPSARVETASASATSPAQGRGRTIAALASGLASVVVGGLLSRRFRGRRRR